MTSPTTGRQGPSSIWFVIGGVLIALAIIGGIVVVVIGVQQVASTVDDYKRVSASTGGEFLIDDPGTYRIFYEAPGAADGFVSAPPFDIVDPNGGMVAIRSDSTDENYTFGSREGRKIGKFTASSSGTYEITVLRGDGLSVVGPRFAIGKRGPTGSIVTILGGVFGGMGVAAIGGLMLIVAGVQRGRAKRSRVAPAPGWGAPPPAGLAIPASEWGAPPSGGVVPQGTQWGTRPDPPPMPPESSTPPGWAPPPTASPPPHPKHEPPPDAPRPPPPLGPIS